MSSKKTGDRVHVNTELNGDESIKVSSVMRGFKSAEDGMSTYKADNAPCQGKCRKD